jgi:RNA polymerase sigma-70 factor (ECF subfamily)
MNTRSARSPSEREVEQINELMRRYGRGEEDAFEPLYKLIAPRLYRFCLRLTSRRTDADDVLQETLLRLHRARATYRAGANTWYWAFAIARSALLDRLRYWRRRPEHLGVASDMAEDRELRAGPEYHPEAELLARDLWHVVRRELRKMSEKNRVAYVLLREEGLSVKEAAVVLGTTADVVKQRAHRAYEQIRSALGAAGWIEPSNDTLSNVPRPLRVKETAFDATRWPHGQSRRASSVSRSPQTTG